MKKVMIVAMMVALLPHSAVADIGDTGDYRQYCTACTPRMWEEVAPYLPRYADGTLMRPIDNTTVLNVYRNLWMSADSAHTSCMNLWADERVKLLVQKAKLQRELNRARSKR